MGSAGAPANSLVGHAFNNATTLQRTGGQRFLAGAGRVGIGTLLSLLPDIGAASYRGWHASQHPYGDLPPVDLNGGQP
jgi:hypothetical protein